MSADAGGNGKTHGGIVGRPQEFGAVPNVKIGRAKEGIADIGHDDHIFGEKAVEALEEPSNGQWAWAGFGLGERARFRGGELGEAPLLPFGPEQPADEILEADLLVGVVADGEFLAGGGDGASGVQPGGEDAEVDIGHEGAKHNDAIARFDVATNLFPAHGAFINAHIEGMLLADDGFAEERGDDRDIGFFGQFRENILQSEAVHLDVRNDDRLDSAVDEPDGIIDGGAEHFQVAGFMNFERPMMWNSWHLHHVPREFDINGALVTEAGMKNAIDFLEGSLRIAEHSGSDSQLLEDFLLSIELADFVVEQRVFLALANAGRAADDNDRAFFGKSAGGGVGDL